MPYKFLKTILISNLVLPFAILTIVPNVQLPSQLHAEEFFESLNDEGEAFQDSDQEVTTEEDSGDEISRDSETVSYSGGSYDSSKKYSDFNKEELKKLQATKLSPEDYKAPKNLGIDGSKKWNEVIDNLSSLMGQISKIKAINIKVKGDLFDVQYKEVSPQNIRLGELEESSSIASFQLLKDFKELKQKLSQSASGSTALLEQFQKKLVETKKALGAHLENISDIGSNDVNQKDEKFKQLMTNLFETKDIFYFHTDLYTSKIF